jgi:uncharacterized integral membrane protein (TIGR00697 family)
MNESLLVMSIVLDLLIVFAAFLCGRPWLEACIIVNLLLISLLGQKIVPMWGFATNVGNVFYASVFFAVYLILENGTSEEARRVIWIATFSIIAFIALMQLALLTSSTPETSDVSGMMNTLFALAPRTALASVLAFIISQYLNLFLYTHWSESIAGVHWWLRIACIIALAQFVDSAIFFSLAFQGVVEHSIVIESLIGGYVIKVAIGLLSIPLLFVSHRFAAPAPTWE